MKRTHPSRGSSASLICIEREIFAWLGLPQHMLAAGNENNEKIKMLRNSDERV